MDIKEDTNMFDDWDDDYDEFPILLEDWDDEEELCGDIDCPLCYPN
jgi:hypothetical protein